MRRRFLLALLSAVIALPFASFRASSEETLDQHNGVLVIDDTAMPKKGTHSIGVAPQYVRHAASP